MANRNIFFYIPNIIGYARLILLALSVWYLTTTPFVFLSLYCSSIILDGFDGYAARKLNQVSTFGAWFDVAIDNLSRGMLWAHVFKFGWLISSVEWMVFVCTHTLGKTWKSSAKASPPLWVQAVMANGFKTPIGAFAIMGLHGLPVWFYIQRAKLIDKTMSPCIQAYVTLCFSAGRLLCFAVESWFIFAHIEDMAALDIEENKDINQKEQPPSQTERVLMREVVARPKARPGLRRNPIRKAASDIGKEAVRRRRRVRASSEQYRRLYDEPPTLLRESSGSTDDWENGQNSQTEQNEVEIQRTIEERSREIAAIREVPSIGGMIVQDSMVEDGSDETLFD